MSALRPPREIARATLLLAGAQATLSACLPLSATIGSVQAVDLAGHHEAAGGAVAVALAGAAVALPIAGTLSDRHGRRIPLALGFGAIGLGGLVAGLAVLAESAPLFFAAIAVFGAGGGLALLSRAAAADLYPPRLRAHGVGLVATAGAIGATLGPLIWTSAEGLGGALGITRNAVPWLLVPVVAAGAVAALTQLRPDPRDVAANLAAWYPGETLPPPPPGPPRGRREMLRLAPARAAIAAAAGAQVAMIGVMAVTAVELHDRGVTGVEIGLLMSAHFIGMFAAAAPVGRMADRIGRRRTVLIGGVVCASGAALTPLLAGSVLIAPPFFLLGLGWCGCFVAGTTTLADITQARERGRLTSTNDLIVSVLGGAASLGGGFLLAGAGFTWVGALAASLALVGLVPMLRLRETAPGVFGDAAEAPPLPSAA